MTTVAPVFLEYRCNRCWNSVIESIDKSGSVSECTICGNENKVPEATPDRIQRALEQIENQSSTIQSEIDSYQLSNDYDRQYSDREAEKIARAHTRVPLRERDFSGYPLASIWTRLF